jgi:predicted NUDIX family phosphoesterase
MNVPEENILVIKRSLFDQLGSFQGLSLELEKYLKTILSRGNNFFLPRRRIEIDPTHKQIIPFSLLDFWNKSHYVRGKRANSVGGERFDRDWWAHNDRDESLLPGQAASGGVEREVNEEIKIDTKFETTSSLLNDDGTEVGRVILDRASSGWPGPKCKNAKR